MLACFLWFSWKAAATFSSEAHTAGSAIQMTQVSQSKKRYQRPLFLPSETSVGYVRCVHVIVMSTWASIGPYCRCEISKQEEGEGGWDWD